MNHAVPFALAALVALPAIAMAQRAPPAAHSAAAARCGDVTGAWSPVVDGLRARLVTRGARADRASLRLVLEVENTSQREAREVHWTGTPRGPAAYRLVDAAGAEVREPGWAFGGNEMAGAMRELIAAGATARVLVAENLFDRFNGARVIRVGVFWARELPAGGSPRFLQARLAGEPDPGNDSEAVVRRATSSTDVSVERARPGEPRGRAWTGTLEVPAVCVD